MSRIAKGIKPGSHVHQGDVIGYVGMTGLATGPHLHYEVRIHNNAVNPSTVKMMPAQKLAGHDLVAFDKAMQAAEGRLAQLSGASVAALLPSH
jgi:murein DD-endopeptidase MepM/ murein hydrolase activator NlpD